MQKRRDGGRVGRRNDGTDEKPADPGSGEEQNRRCSDDRGRGNYAYSSEGYRRPQRTSDGARIGAYPAVEQNNCEADAADQIGGREVTKKDVARALRAGEHA